MNKEKWAKLVDAEIKCGCSPDTGDRAEYFKTMMLGNFEPDERRIALIERWEKYHDDTPYSMDNKESMTHYSEFTKWCDNNGYTQEEINMAKRCCRY